MSQQNFVSYDDATSIVTEVASKIAAKQDELSFDNSPTQNSDNPVKSGGVYTALTSKANTSDIGTAAAKNFTTSVTSGSNDLVTSGAVYTAIDNLPEPMVFKGSLGTGGTITALPVNGTATVGDTYKVITAGTYDSKAAKVGDTFICLTKTSSANTWELIPSGDEPSGTVTSVTIKATSPIAIDSSSAITSSGTRTLSHANSGATAGSYGDSGNQTPGYGSTFKVPYVTVNATGHVTAISEHTVKIPASDNTNTTYTFAGGTNGFTVTPSGGSAQTVSVTPNDSTKLPLAGGTMTGNLTISKSSPRILLSNSDAVAVGTDVPLLQASYKSTNNVNMTVYPISIIGNASTSGYNTPVRLGSTNGMTVLGAGESSSNFASKQSINDDENLYLVTDANIKLYKGMANDGSLGYGPYEAAGFSGTITSGQVVISDGTVGGVKCSGYTIGKSVPSDAKFTDTKYTAATAAPGAIAASGAAGTSTNYARQDHTHGITVATGDSNGQVKIAGQNASVKGLGSNAYTSTSYLPLAGGTMTGQILTSFKSAVAMGSRQADATTIETLCNELRYSSGCAGSVATTAAYTKNNITIPAGWYNYLWMPHRSGGSSGSASGDNCNYGSLLLSGMTLSGCYMIRYSSSAISELKNLYANTTYTASTTSVGSASAGTAIAADDITAWSAGSMTSASYASGVLTITNGSAPSLSYTARSIPNISVSSKTVVTGITAG